MTKKIRQAPRERGVPRTPRGEPLAQAPPPEPIGVAPAERGIAARPHPRKPRVVRDVHGNELMDLFEVFPDLPHPPRRHTKFPRRRPRRP